jgi:hypothetical protein
MDFEGINDFSRLDLFEGCNPVEKGQGSGFSPSQQKSTAEQPFLRNGQAQAQYVELRLFVKSEHRARRGFQRPLQGT